MDWFKKKEKGLAMQYSRLIGKNVRIYLQDGKGISRSLMGMLVSIDKDLLWLKNGNWEGAVNCANNRIGMVSTIEGWNKEKEYETK